MVEQDELVSHSIILLWSTRSAELNRKFSTFVPVSSTDPQLSSTTMTNRSRRTAATSPIRAMRARWFSLSVITAISETSFFSLDQPLTPTPAPSLFMGEGVKDRVLLPSLGAKRLGEGPGMGAAVEFFYSSALLTSPATGASGVASGVR